MVLPEKEIKDAQNGGSNHRLCPCLERLSRECVHSGYAPGAKSPSQIGDRQSGRIPLLTAVRRRICVADPNVRALTISQMRQQVPHRKEVIAYGLIELGRRRIIIQKSGTTSIEAALKSR